MQATKKRKLFIILFSLIFFFTFSGKIHAEQVSEIERDAIILESSNYGYKISLPEYVMSSKNTQIIRNDKYNIYINKTKLNDKYGILTFVFRAKDLIESDSLMIEVPNAVPYDNIIDFNEVNWANTKFMKSFSGGTRNNDTVSIIKVEQMAKYSTFQVGFIYKLEDEDKIDFKMNSISNEDFTKLYNSQDSNFTSEEASIVKHNLESVSSINIKSDSENINFISYSELENTREEKAKDSYNQNKTDGEVVKESKYPWLLPSSIIASIVILAIVIYIMRKYVKNK